MGTFSLFLLLCSIKMKYTLGAFVVLFACVASLNLPPSDTSRVEVGKIHPCVEEKNCAVHDWELSPYQHKLGTVKLVFFLNQQNADSCDDLLMDISHPDSENFGKMYSFEDIGSIFRNDEAIKRTKWWIASHGVHPSDLNITPNGELISVTVSHEKAEKILNTKFDVYISSSAIAEIIRARSYTLPKWLLEHVSFVGNVVSFPSTKLRPLIKSFDTSENPPLTTPDVINKFYNIKDNKCTNKDTTQALFESLGQQFSPADLETFQKQLNLPVDPIDHVIGHNSPILCKINPNSCGEANLDVQYMQAIAQNADTSYYSEPSTGDPFLNWIEQVAQDANPPSVHSMSYGSIETMDDQSSMKQFNLEACKLGLRRVSLFISSGDDGVANFQARGDSSKCGFTPSYPSSCPYVTSVGATMGPESGDDESACQSDKGGVITTGGGFSTVFDAPDYQKDAISNYKKIATNLPPSGDYNGSGRGYPDISALGHNYPIVDGGNVLAVSGTSASSPVVAAMVTLVNDQRLNAGKNPIGFLNPALYSSKLAGVFNDITSGDNKCCAEGGGCCEEGFYCAKGWDPVTGLGSVNFEKFAAALVALP